MFEEPFACCPLGVGGPVLEKGVHHLDPGLGVSVA